MSNERDSLQRGYQPQESEWGYQPLVGTEAKSSLETH